MAYKNSENTDYKEGIKLETLAVLKEIRCILNDIEERITENEEFSELNLQNLKSIWGELEYIKALY